METILTNLNGPVISFFTKNDQVANLWNLDVLGIIVDPGQRETREETAVATKELFQKIIKKSAKDDT